MTNSNNFNPFLLLAKVEYTQTKEEFLHATEQSKKLNRIRFSRDHKASHLISLGILVFLILNRVNFVFYPDSLHRDVHHVLFAIGLIFLIGFSVIVIMGSRFTLASGIKYKKSSYDNLASPNYKIAAFLDGLLIQTPQFQGFVPWPKLRVVKLNDYIQVDVNQTLAKEKSIELKNFTTLFIPKHLFPRHEFFTQLAQGQCYYLDTSSEK
ncbi:hypothetical protein [Thorsellia kenyensis]|uniref:Photosystem I assembly protein Ycf4 n=1 Tax=Thorsellia kenyensis TaxID=1549888 RepID=A0ABV6C7D2_9GAMM